MRTLTVSVLGAMTLGCAGHRVSTAPEPRLLFFDDFSSPSLDRTKWNVEVRGAAYNDEQQAYVDSAPTVFIANGALVIRPIYRPGYVSADNNRHDFLSGHLDSHHHFDFTYGVAAARMKLPSGSGFWPAFWLLGAGDWPATGEIDIMENVGEADWTSVALHGPGYSGDTPLFNRLYLAANADVTQWHVYSVDWRPDTLTFYVDKTLVYRATRPMIESYGRWSYDNPKFIILNLALGGAYPLKTNGVRLPYPGLPQETVDKIRRGDGDVLVDWVRVTAGP